MPKKNSSWGTNTKAEEANERKAEKKRVEKETKEKQKSDAEWKDDNKLDQRKKDRKDTAEQKKLDAVARKEEARRLLAEEESGTSTKSKAGGGGGKGSKVTLSEIEKIKELEKKKAEARRIAKQKEKARITEAPELEAENPNRAMAAMLEAEGAVEARCLEDALSVLNTGGAGGGEDKHPEKRMKAAYQEFEARELPLLKQEYPKLRLSQLKEMLWKQWQKHPDNPLNAR